MPTIAPMVGESANAGAQRHQQAPRRGRRHGPTTSSGAKRLPGCSLHRKTAPGANERRRMITSIENVSDASSTDWMSGSLPPTSRGSNQATSPTTPPITAARSGSGTWGKAASGPGRENYPIVGRAQQPRGAYRAGDSPRRTQPVGSSRGSDDEVEAIAKDSACNQDRRGARGQGGHHQCGRRRRRANSSKTKAMPLERRVECHREPGPCRRTLRRCARLGILELSCPRRHLGADGGADLHGGDPHVRGKARILWQARPRRTRPAEPRQGELGRPRRESRLRRAPTPLPAARWRKPLHQPGPSAATSAYPPRPRRGLPSASVVRSTMAPRR